MPCSRHRMAYNSKRNVIEVSNLVGIISWVKIETQFW